MAKRSGRNRVEIAEGAPDSPEDLESQAPVAIISNGAAVDARESRS